MGAAGLVFCIIFGRKSGSKQSPEQAAFHLAVACLGLFAGKLKFCCFLHLLITFLHPAVLCQQANPYVL